MSTIHVKDDLTGLAERESRFDLPSPIASKCAIYSPFSHAELVSSIDSFSHHVPALHIDDEGNDGTSLRSVIAPNSVMTGAYFKHGLRLPDRPEIRLE
ncbi:hypothetical protein [Pseudomonas sp. VEM90]